MDYLKVAYQLKCVAFHDCFAIFIYIYLFHFVMYKNKHYAWNAGDGGEVTTAHMLLGVWSQEESPGRKILASLGLNDEKVKELKSKILEPGILDD